MNESIRELLKQLEALDPWERAHAERVAVYATATAHRVGLRGDDLVTVRIAAQLHDVGKLKEVVGHPDHAASWVAPFGEAVARAVAEHHERVDGCGYPRGLEGEAISLPGQIVGLCEYFDVALHGSPFSDPRPLEEVRTELEADPAFAPELVAALFAIQRVVQPIGT